MNSSRILKLGGLSLGGMVAVIAGAVGTHFAEPFLERKFFPNRLDEEKKLKESLDSKRDDLDKLAEELMDQESLQEKQIKEVSNLTNNLSDLNKQLTDKSLLLSEKETQLKSKESDLETQKALYAKQEQEISSLQQKATSKEDEITTEKNAKEKVNKELTQLNERIHLTNEQILTEEGNKFNLLDITTQKIELKKFDGTFAHFETKKWDGSTTSFKVQKPDSFTNHLEKAEEIKKQGISIEFSEKFKTWDKQLVLYLYEAGYHLTQTDSQCERSYVLDKKTENFSLTTYFKEPYWEDALKVFAAIGHLDVLPISFILSQGKTFKFHLESNVKMNFSVSGKSDWQAFDKSKNIEMSIWTNRFKTKDDLIKYWITKTIEFIKYRRIDFFDFINPIVLPKNYETQN